MTKAVYQDDTYLFECDAVVQQVNPVEGSPEYDVVLDQTVFYPQGGGQPSDKGQISANDVTFNVAKVTKNRETGCIAHRGSFAASQIFTPQINVKCKIDGELRLLHARYHLAGHLIDMALIELGAHEKWCPIQGNHSPTGAYVEFKQSCPETTADTVKSFMDLMESKCNELIKRDLKSTCQLYRPIEIPEYGQRLLSDDMKKMEKVRINRVESIDAYWMPCGGTLCSKLGELGIMSIPKYSFKKGILRICYALAA